MLHADAERLARRRAQRVDRAYAALVYASRNAECVGRDLGAERRFVSEEFESWVALDRCQAAHLLVVFISVCQEAGKRQELRIQIRRVCAAQFERRSAVEP